MPSELQSIMKKFFIDISNIFVFIDDTLIVFKGTKEEPEEKVEIVRNEIERLHSTYQKRGKTAQ